MTMKKIFTGVLVTIVFFACKSKDDAPDVSDIPIDLKLQRFDRDFFSIDTGNIEPVLEQLGSKYHVITTIFLQNILGLDSATLFPGIRRFISMSGPLYDTINAVFSSTVDIEKDFKKGFQYLKHYFPKYQIPIINTVVGPVDVMAQSNTGPTPDFLAPGVLGISLQFYLGKNFSVYREPFFIENVAPSYRSRRFSKEYMIADAMQLLISDMFPYQSGSKPLVEQMVEKGKRWWLLDKLLPGKPDSIITGYTAQQLQWCKKNEGLIWSYIVKNEDLYSLSPVTIQTYLGEGPFTQGFHQDYSPGNLGQWIGWQMMQKFAEKNKSMTLEEIMNTDPKKILEEARYKPK